jgi:hypothetical protein
MRKIAIGSSVASGGQDNTAGGRKPEARLGVAAALSRGEEGTARAWADTPKPRASVPALGGAVATGDAPTEAGTASADGGAVNSKGDSTKAQAAAKRSSGTGSRVSGMPE